MFDVEHFPPPGGPLVCGYIARANAREAGRENVEFFRHAAGAEAPGRSEWIQEFWASDMHGLTRIAADPTEPALYLQLAAVYRRAARTWFVSSSFDDSYQAFQFGVETDVPVAGDYDGDGKTDFAVIRPESRRSQPSASHRSMVSSVTIIKPIRSLVLKPPKKSAVLFIRSTRKAAPSSAL